MKCRKCGAVIADNSIRCSNCGIKVNMLCPECHTLNAFGSMFCSGCGSELLKKCSSCNTINIASAQTCRKCGQPLDEKFEITLPEIKEEQVIVNSFSTEINEVQTNNNSNETSIKILAIIFSFVVGLFFCHSLIVFLILLLFAVILGKKFFKVLWKLS